MQRDPRFETLLKNLNHNPSKPVGLLQKLGAIAAAAVLFGLALTFSVIFFAVVVAAGILIWGYVWWKTRDLRKAMRATQARARASAQGRGGPKPGQGIVIEGEVVREVREERRDGTQD
ncbi:CPBP family intramembrane glutamic endopeptidase [Aromatoleum aromaticum]|uniref:CPBP family intramembrane glutamic endopeptidase n=1 Tax=Aromatoleum aromaticum TaxID=551760 RepID=UPI0002D2E834|nr:CPBP family intramembrane glutamic endopeptidase [Aromatoleum aromaticum]